MSPSSRGLKRGPAGPGLGLGLDEPLADEQPALCRSRFGQDLAAGKQPDASGPSGFSESMPGLLSSPEELQVSAGGDSTLERKLAPDDSCGELVLVVSCRIAPPFTDRKS